MEKKQEPRFKVGDKVICINDKSAFLTSGKTYTVLNQSGNMIKIHNDNGTNVYSTNRFVPWCPAFESLFS